MIYTYGANGSYHNLQPLEYNDFGFSLAPIDPTPPRARHPIGVNQPPNGGTDYPFIRPSPDIYFLLGDFYLSYPDDTCSYAYPFRIEWMYGFGTRQYSESGSEVDPLPGYPTPTHEYDVLIKDANDVTVFDSTLVGVGDDEDNVDPFKYNDWYSRYIVIEWTDRSKDIVCRCTKFIGWDSYSTDYQMYDEYIVPTHNTGTVTTVASSFGKTRLTITYEQDTSLHEHPLLQENDVIYVRDTDVPSYNVAHTVVDVPGGEITGVTLTGVSPIVITSSGHGLSTGDRVHVNDVLGYVPVETGTTITGTTGDTVSPIVITSTDHGLSSGNQVYITDVLGNTAANGTFYVTVVDSDQFSLNGSTGNGAYTSGGECRRYVENSVLLNSNGTFTVTAVDTVKFSLDGSTGNGIYISGGEWLAPETVVTDVAYVQAITTAGVWQQPGGTLDPRTHNKLPLRVRSLTVRGVYGDLGTFLQGNISLHSNYNIEIQDNPQSIGFIDFNPEDLGLDQVNTPVIEGSRLTNRIAINSAPGLGTGAFPSCNPDDIDVPLRRLNDAKGDDKQNITLDSGIDCIRLQRPVTLVNDCPRQFEFDPTVVPAPETGAHTNRLINDCVSCCDCDYFARTYQGLKRQWNAYQVIADDTIEARDQFKENVTRWNYQKECRESHPTMLVVRILPNCTVDVGVTFGNTSPCCLVDVHMRLTCEYYNGFEWVEYPTDNPCDQGIIRALEFKTTQSRNEVKPATPIGKFPVVDVVADILPASSTFQVAAKFCFPGCMPASKFRCHIHIWWEDSIKPEHIATCNFPAAMSIDTGVLDVWQRAGMDVPPYNVTYGESSNTKDLNQSSAFCTSDGVSCEKPLDCSIG